MSSKGFLYDGTDDQRRIINDWMDDVERKLTGGRMVLVDGKRVFVEDIAHLQQHDLNGTEDHVGVEGDEDSIVKLDSSGLPQTTSSTFTHDSATDIVSLDAIQFLLTSVQELEEGQLGWDQDNSTATLGMSGGQVKQQIGLEDLVRVSNKTGSTIANGTLVYVNGVQGGSLTIGKSDRTDVNSIFILGLTTEDIQNNTHGWVAQRGDVRGNTAQPVNTSGFAEGAKLYLDTNGMYVDSHPPGSTDAVVVIGRVKKVHATDGIISLQYAETFTVGNEFNGTIRQSVINKSTGINAASGFTAVNDNNHFTTMGIAGSGNTLFPGEVSVYYAPGYGDHWQAVDGAKDFVWFTDPTDSHNNSSLDYERMRLTSDGELILAETRNVSNRLDLFNGTFHEPFDARVTSDGATIPMTLEKSGGGDLTMQFSTGDFALDCTPALSIDLAAGSIPSPQKNYVYIPIATKVLTLSTSGFPDTEHIPIGFFFVSTAAVVQADVGTLINQNINNEAGDHLVHVGEKIRIGMAGMPGAGYHDGIDGAGVDGYTTSAAGTVHIKYTTGEVYQAHVHTVPALDSSTSDDFHVPNAHATDGGAYFETSNLYDITVDSAGASLNNKYFNVILAGVANKTGEYSPALVMLPSGSYNTLAGAQGDTNGYDATALPRQFTLDSSTGFLISRETYRKTGGTWVWQSSVNLRGTSPSVISGSGTTGIVTEFVDNTFAIYDDGDVTAKIAFQANLITAATTRTITMPDADVTLMSATGSIVGSTLSAQDFGSNGVKCDTIAESTGSAGVKIASDVGFYSTTPVSQQTGVAVTAAGIHAALVSLGLITA